MRHYTYKIVIILILGILIVGFKSTSAQESGNGKITREYIDNGIKLLQKYFFTESNWHTTQNSTGNHIRGLIDFIQNEPIDTSLNALRKELTKPDCSFVFRIPEKIQDSLSVPGFYPLSKLSSDFKILEEKLKSDLKKRNIAIPDNLLENIETKAKTIPAGEGIKLFARKIYKLPDSLHIMEVIPDSMLKDAESFKRLIRLENMRDQYIENKRQHYNDSVIEVYRESVTNIYLEELYGKELVIRKKALSDSVVLNNYQAIKAFNDAEVKLVNDSISDVLNVLTEFANYSDSIQLNLSNNTFKSESIILNQFDQRYARLWLKNAQNDSLSVLVRNMDKRSIQLLIDDAVTFNRFTERKTKEFDFSTLAKKNTGISKFGKSYELVTPWRIGGDGNLGFTQTYLENWKKGGKSALSLLVVLKGFANYSRPDGKIKWENSGEIRNGWIRQGGAESELQKNDDKLELTSRFGVSAFNNKKWFYSTEFTFETQFFNGYIYPVAKNPKPISSFMSPSRTFFKIGLDYKPSKELSLLLSPLTLKNVYVKDTMNVDPTKFGIEKGKNKFWEPGLNADFFYKKEISKDFTYETKYKMFVNYKQPFNKYDINWENLMILRFNRYIDMRLMLHLIYDDDVLFPVYDDNKVKIGEKPKLQLKQLMTVGFSYRINHQVVHTRRLR